jgi:excisionase family DNA binding protein
MTEAPPIPGAPLRLAAFYLNVKRDSVYRWVREGKLRAERDPCGQLVIPYDELIYQHRRQKEERN